MKVDKYYWVNNRAAFIGLGYLAILVLCLLRVEAGFAQSNTQLVSTHLIYQDKTLYPLGVYSSLKTWKGKVDAAARKNEEARKQEKKKSTILGREVD